VPGIGTDAALARIDPAAARAALADALLPEGDDGRADGAGAPAGRARAGAGRVVLDRATAAEACARLMHALLRHRPFPAEAEQVAVAAGLQFLAVNGWQADLDPPAAAALVVQSLASGRLAPAQATAWLMTARSRAH